METEGSNPGESQSRGVLRRLEVSVFIRLFVPAIILATLVLALVAWVYVQGEQSNLRTRERSVLDLSATALTDDFDTLLSDLRLLRNSLALKRYLSQTDMWALRDFKEEMLGFVVAKGSYDQVRFIDDDGNEIVRAQRRKNESEIVPDHFLQNKKERYYFTETMELDNNEVFISKLDLNVENGVVEKPIRPVLRFATPVFDNLEQKRGILIFNFRTARTLDATSDEMKASAGKPHLLNTDGEWMISPDPGDAWGSALGHDRSFAAANPDAWTQIEKEDRGEVSVAGATFIHKSIYPLEETRRILRKGGLVLGGNAEKRNLKRHRWILISEIPSGAFSAVATTTFRRALAFYGVVVVVLALGGWMIARVRAARTLTERKLDVTERKLAEAHQAAQHLAAIVQSTKRRHPEHHARGRPHLLEPGR